MPVAFRSADPEALLTLQGLVEHYSPSGEEAGAVAWLVERMTARGYIAHIDQAGNAVGILGDGPRQVILLGHIDTVPGETPVRREGGDLYGRGTVDAKGPLAAFVEAAARIGPHPGWQMLVIGAVDEERDSSGARYIAGQYQPDFVLVGEPNGWQRVALGYKGSLTGKLRVEIPQAHSAAQTSSAPEIAVDLWGRLQTWAQAYNAKHARMFDQLLLSLRHINSGGDGLQEWAELIVGARLPVELPPLAYIGQVTALLEIENPAGAVVEWQTLGSPIPAYRAEKNTPLVRAMLAGIRLAGGTPAFVYKTGTADLNIVAPQWGCPALVYGPGDAALDHTPHEHIELQDYYQSIEVLSVALAHLTIDSPPGATRV